MFKLKQRRETNKHYNARDHMNCRIIKTVYTNRNCDTFGGYIDVFHGTIFKFKAWLEYTFDLRTQNNNS